MRCRFRLAPPERLHAFGWDWGPAPDFTDPARGTAGRAIAEAPVVPDSAEVPPVAAGPEALGWAWGPPAEASEDADRGGISGKRVIGEREGGAAGRRQPRAHAPAAPPQRLPASIALPRTR
jgi:hypothetical protein